MTNKQEISIATPVGMLGYGYPYIEFDEACARAQPDYIIADAGSTDSGPQKLALGVTTCPRESYEADLGALLNTAHKVGARVLIGSCGGDGTNAHVDLFIEIIRKHCQEQGYTYKVRSIYSDVAPSLVLEQLAAGKITPCGPVPKLTSALIKASRGIVAQMGAEPYVTALRAGFDIIIGGRSYDPSMYAGAAIYHGIDPATAWHMGKINECGAQCGVPKSPSIITIVRPGSFDLHPIMSSAKCTPLSVAAHTLYEKSRPDVLIGPGGILKLGDACLYEQITERSVRVSGAVFQPMPYTVKLEGGRSLGFRSMAIGGIRDPTMLENMDLILPAIVERISGILGDQWDDEFCKICWHQYGKNAVMGPLEPEMDHKPKELGMLIETLAPTQALATRIANLARVYLMHVPYPGQLATAANYASCVTPLEVPLGRVCEFSIYHILPLSDPEAIFEVRDYQFEFVVPQTLVNGADPTPSAITTANGEAKKAPAGVEKPTPYFDALYAAMYTRPTMFDLINKGRTSATLSEIAQVVRTKNAGPFELTMDIMFTDEKVYEWVKQSGVLNIEDLSRLYNIDPKTVCACLFYKPALAFKFTIPRAISQGSFGETDMHGGQQHIPLLDIKVPLPPQA